MVRRINIQVDPHFFYLCQRVNAHDAQKYPNNLN